MSNLAISPFTMPAALAAADQLINDAVWIADPANARQVAWAESFRRRAALAAGMAEIRRHATFDVAEHVAWLRSEGWDAQITSGTESDIFLAATLNIVAKWRHAGRAYSEAGIDRAVIKQGAFTGARSKGERPVVEVVTQHPSYGFCFQQVERAPADPEALHAIALDMASRSANQEVYLDFPMVDLCVRDDAAYMIGLHSGCNMVSQAAEQMRLELNEIGGRASAAAEVAVTRGMGPGTVKIDGPFIVAVNRNGAPADADKVVFAAYCDRSCWKAPAIGRI